MKILFGAENWILYLLVYIVVAAAVTIITYYRNKEAKVLNMWQKRVLLSLRFVSFLFLSVILLSPLINTIKKIVSKPVIISAFDNSLSVIASEDSIQIKQEIISFYDDIQDQLGEEFNLINYTFGETSVTNKTLGFNEKQSDYSKLINSVYNNHFNENIGALIIIGDGIYNMGANPVLTAQKLNFPIYSIGVGDTTIVKDAVISEIRVNRNVFTGNKFPVELDLSFKKMANEPSAIQIMHKGEIVYNKRILPVGNDFFTTVSCLLSNDSPGLQHYSVKLTNSTSERNKKNNNSDFVINVLEDKQKILILSEGPHPDPGAIKNTLELNQNYDVTIFTHEPYPENYNDFNLIILNQIPSVSRTGSELIKRTFESKTPLLFIVGNKTFLPQINQLDIGIEVLRQTGSNEEAQAIINKGYEIFNMSEELIEMIERFPPLLVPFANFNLESSYTPVFYQNINNIKTLRPLIATGNMNSRKTAFIFGEGIWRWRLYNYYFNESHDQFNEFLNSVIQYLALKENDENLIVDYQNVFDETENVILKAEVYNEAFEAINEPEVSITIINNKDVEYEFAFDRNGDYYKLNAGNLPIGDYNFIALVTVGEEVFTKTGSFAVVPVNIENVVTKANHNVLFQIANQTGGEFYFLNNTTNLIDRLKNREEIRPYTYFQTSIDELLNLKWLFVFLILLFGMEWFLRKYWGIY